MLSHKICSSSRVELDEHFCADRDGPRDVMDSVEADSEDLSNLRCLLIGSTLERFHFDNLSLVRGLPPSLRKQDWLESTVSEPCAERSSR